MTKLENEMLITIYKLRNKLDVCIILLVGSGIVIFMGIIACLIVTKK